MAVSGLIALIMAWPALTKAFAQLSIEEAGGGYYLQPQSSGTAASVASSTATAGEPVSADFTTGDGLKVVSSQNGELRIACYLLVRYLNQLPPTQSFTDHLDVKRNIDTANYYSAPHRVLLNFMGWIYEPKYIYQATVWTVNATDKVAVIGNLGYKFSKAANLYVGTGANPGTRTLTYSHPYWLATDRVMADEFFRPGFSFGTWLSGEPLSGLNYTAMMSNNLSTLNINATENTREFCYSGTVWWMPTTKEFGPKGGFGDFEDHKDLATRFGVSYTQSRENRFTQDPANAWPDNTQIRMADSLLLFQRDALAPGITVQDATYRMAAMDAGFKYKGLHVQAEGYMRRLDSFVADGPVPVNNVIDTGFYIEAAKMVQTNKTEIYAGTSQIFGDKGAGYSDSSEIFEGVNFFLYGTRNSRINIHVIEVYKSPASSVFGYYVGGQTGVTVSASWLINF
jgi:hypothetical protein